MPAGNAGLEGEVIPDIQARDQVELLKHQSQPVTPQLGAAGIGQVGDRNIGEPDLAGVGAVQSGDQMQQRAFAAAGLPGQRDALARRDAEVHAAQHHGVLAAGAIALGEIANPQHHGAAGCHGGRPRRLTSAFGI